MNIDSISIGDKVITIHGPGIVCDIESYSREDNNRYGVKLKHNPFTYPVAYYFKREVKKFGKCKPPKTK